MQFRLKSPTSILRLIRRKSLVALLLLSIGAFLFDHRSLAQGQVQVTAADPPAAEQGTINLNVKVSGRGFKNGVQAKWFVTGTTNPGGVTVNSTTFVSSTELSANITVADTATIADFDVQVTNSDGRGGKGTELFAVTAKGNDRSQTNNLIVTIDPLAGACKICADTPSTLNYPNGVNSVTAGFSTYGDFVFISGTRSVQFIYDTSLGDSQTTKTLPPSEKPTQVQARTFKTRDPYTNLQDMFVGQQQCLGLGWFIGQGTNSERSIGYRYGRGVLTNTSFVVVTRDDANTWTMEPGPQSLCSSTFLYDSVGRVRDAITSKGKTTDYDYGRYIMPFKLTLTRQ